MSCGRAIYALKSCENSRAAGDFPRSTGPNRIGMIGPSLYRVGLGLFWAIMIGVPLGIIIGWIEPA